MAKTDGDGWCSASRGVGVQAKEGRSDHIVAWHDSTSGTPCVQSSCLFLFCVRREGRAGYMLLWSDITSGNKFSLHKTFIMFAVMCTTMKTVHFLLILLL